MGFTVWLKNIGDQTSNSLCTELKQLGVYAKWKKKP